ncbi:ATP-binding protein [Streptomyces sp. NPDC058583]|uniref:ATP-binding protein n=1 Tax=unclassified Streptomyces TaxID=2593676 RepID=UPI003657F544
MLFGREGELTELQRQANSVRAGRGGLVVVSGPTGAGKSSLLRAFGEGPGTDGMTVLSASCAEGGSPYAAVRTLYAPLGLAGRNAATHPLLRDGAHRAAEPALTATHHEAAAAPSAYPVLQGLYRLTADLVTERPLALLLDDAHECDEHSLNWFEFLLRRSEGLPLLLVLAHRAESEQALRGAWSSLDAHPSCTRLGLDPLGEDTIGAMARHVFGTPADPTFVTEVAVITGGIPGIAARLLHGLRDEGTRPDAAGRQRAADLGTSLIVASVRELLDHGAAWTRAVALAAAVLDGGPTEHVTALAGVSPALSLEAMARLREAGAVRPGATRFVHEEVRSAVLGRLGPEALAHLRKRAALVLSDAGRPAEESARHLLAVPGSPEPWMRGLLRDAAAEAEDCGAADEAARYLHRVLDAEPDDGAARLRLAGVLARTDPRAALPVIEETLDRATDPRTRAAAAVHHATTCFAVQRPEDAGRDVPAVLGELAARAEADGPDTAYLRAALQAVLLITGRPGAPAPADVLDRLDRVPAQPQHAARTARPHADALGAFVAALYGGSPETAVRHARRALDGTAHGREGWPLLASATALSLADRTDEALRALDRATPAPGATGLPRALALSARALVLYGTGALDATLATARSALHAAEDEPDGGARLALPRLLLAGALAERGAAGDAEDLLAYMPRPDASSVLEHQLYLMTRARARWALGDGEAALRLLRAAGRAQEEAGTANPVFAPWWADACHVLAALHRPDEARGHAEAGTEAATRWGTPRARGTAALARGVLAPHDARTGLLEEAVAELGQSPARGEHARAEYELGRTLLHQGDRRAARRHLRAASDLAGGCGALPLAHAARRLHIAAGGRMEPVTGSSADLLTGAERKIVHLVLQGTSNRGIAQRLCVTVRTVETHLTSAYRKLGVHRREQLAAVLSTPGSLVARIATDLGPASGAH